MVNQKLNKQFQYKEVPKEAVKELFSAVRQNRKPDITEEEAQAIEAIIKQLISV